MKKTVLVLAALAVFSFPGVAFSADYEGYADWVQGDSDYWKKGGKTKAVAVKMKNAAGDITDLRSLGRGGVPGALFAAGTYAASIIWEDELNELNNKSLFELFMGSNSPSLTTDDGTWQSGYFYAIGTLKGNVSTHGPTVAIAAENSGCSDVYYVSGYPKCNVASDPYSPIDGAYINKYQCAQYSTGEASACGSGYSDIFGADPEYIHVGNGRLVPYDTSLVFPYNNGVSVYTSDEGEQVIITAEPNSIGGIDIINSRTTQNAAGEEVTQDSKIVMDDQGMIVNVSTGAVTPTVNIANPVNVNIDTASLAQESTLQSLKNWFQEPATETDQSPITDIGQDVVADINNSGGELAANPITLPVPDGGGLCHPITIDVDSPTSLGFSMNGQITKHCDFIDGWARPTLEYLLALGVLIYGWHRFNQQAGRGVN